MPVDVKSQITEALLQLLEKKNLEKITVTELAAMCGISRQTFYYHFEDVLDVVDWWSRQSAKQLMDESLRTDAPRQALRLFVDYAAEHQHTLQHLLDSRWREQLEHRLMRVFTAYLQEMLRRVRPNLAISPSDEEAFVQFYACGILGLIVKRQAQTEAEKEVLTDQLYRLLFHNPWRAILHP